jgi:hypothetical protein
MTKTINYNKKQWANLLEMGDAKLYKNTEDVLKWYAFKIWYEQKRKNKPSFLSRFIGLCKALKHN